jgi:hypothetical protein
MYKNNGDATMPHNRTVYASVDRATLFVRFFSVTFGTESMFRIALLPASNVLDSRNVE